MHASVARQPQGRATPSASRHGRHQGASPKECAEQGIPEKVEDPAIIANVVTLAFEGLAIPSREP